MTTTVDRTTAHASETVQGDLRQQVEELQRRVTELEEWLGEVADDLIERTGVA